MTNSAAPAQVRKTGRRIVEREEPHVWHFDAGGKVARFRHAADTLQQHRAFVGARARHQAPARAARSSTRPCLRMRR